MANNYYKPKVWNAFCTSCKEEKAVEFFYLHSNGKPRKQCKICHLQRSKKWAQANPELRYDSVKKQRKKYPEKFTEYYRTWRLKNKEFDAFRAATRRATKKQQTPTWANLDKIKEIYLNCPKGYHVDHIVPLQGRLVSGLHVETNLQYLSASDNIRKYNHYGS